MKVCMLIAKMEPSETGVYVGGSVNSLLSLVKGLDQNVSIDIITSLPSGKIPLFNKYLPSCANHVVFPNNQRPQTIMFGFIYMLRVLLWAVANRKNNYDIIHGHSGYAVYGWVTYLAGLILGCRRIHTIYCPIEENGKVDNKKNIFLKRELSIYPMNRLDKIIAMSENIATSLNAAGVKSEKIIFLPPAIDSTKYRPEVEISDTRERLGIVKEDQVILYVGNLMRSKGLDVLIESMSEVIKVIKSVKLIITLELKHDEFGKREEWLLNRIDELGLNNYVKQVGIIDYMPKLMCVSDIFVSPYRDTQGPSDYPIALMEAMSSSRCVVGTNIGGIPEIITDDKNGKLVSPNDPESLSKVIIALLSDHERRLKMGEDARKEILRKYSIAAVAEMHLDIYDNSQNVRIGQRI